jgi:hypothetical protein
MTEDISNLDPETFLRLALERGGLDLDTVLEGLTPEVAETLRLITTAAKPSPTPQQARSAKQPAVTRSALEVTEREWGGERGVALGRQAPRCPSCGRTAREGDRFCRQCGHRLDEPEAALTLDDLVAEGRLTTEQAEKIRRTILDYQRNYPAGTRYSVFGGPQ